MSVRAMIDHVLQTHHETEKAQLAALDARIAPLSDKRLVAPWRHLHDTLLSHMAKEEQILFPAILAMAEGQPGMDFRCAIDGMSYEHEILATYEVALRAAARDAGELEEPILALLDDLLVHATYEEQTLFPAAMALREATLAPEPTPSPDPPPKAHAPYPAPTPGLRARAHQAKERLKGLLHL